MCLVTSGAYFGERGSASRSTVENLNASALPLRFLVFEPVPVSRGASLHAVQPGGRSAIVLKVASGFRAEPMQMIFSSSVLSVVPQTKAQE
jgi:hypothetical protein